MSKVLSRILVTVYLSLLCQACITEVDVGACNNTVIRFEYLADGDEDVFPEYITSVTYCIYDSEGEIVTQASRDKEEIVYGESDLDADADLRVSWGLFRDRRPEIYKSIR